jgi:D-sedoheptulose 7-phosphate isomerase
VSFSETFLAETIDILQATPADEIEAVATLLAATRDRGGRLFFCGSGGGAGHASHATCDFRKLGGFEAYCVTDNVSELTARVNDEGWDTSYSEWLRGSRLNERDTVFVFSVGGGDRERNISVNLVNAMALAREIGASITGIVGRDGGLVAEWSDACITVPPLNPAMVTPQTEGLQALFWHLLISHPAVASCTPKWESSV